MNSPHLRSCWGVAREGVGTLISLGMSECPPADTTATEVLHPHPAFSIIHTDIAALAEIEGGREGGGGVSSE